jgi:hypothetical protein
MKNTEKNNLKWWKKQKILKLKKNAFETQKQTRFYKTWLKKHAKTALQKLCFKLNFLVGSVIKKRILIYYQVPSCVFYTANTKTKAKQTHPSVN